MGIEFILLLSVIGVHTNGLISLSVFLLLGSLFVSGGFLLRGRQLFLLGLFFLLSLLFEVTLGLGGSGNGGSNISLSFVLSSLLSFLLLFGLLLNIITLSMLLGFLRVFFGVLVGLFVMLLPVDSKLKELSISNWGSIELDGLADLGVGKGAD
jgi:hypothetical protein